MKHNLENSELTIIFESDLVSTSVKDYLNSCKDLIASHDDINQVIVDIEQVSMIDSQGLNLLVGLYQECNKRDWSFKVTGTSPSLKRLFDFVKMTERFGIER